MDDLISRAAAIEAVTDWKVKPDGEIFNAIKAACRSKIEQIPAVDAVPVVRCRDCKHRDPEDKKCDYGGMAVQGLFFPRPDDWYCADGERRDESLCGC